MWAKEGILDIINPTNDFYLVKFNNYLDYKYAFTRASWLIYDHYLIIQLWDPNFDVYEDEIEKIVICVRLLGLLIRSYDEKFLTFVGNRIWKTLKMDATTFEQLGVSMLTLC